MSKFTFRINNLEELITAGSIVSDNDRVTVSGKQLKNICSTAIILTDTVNRCHVILSDIGVPGSPQGIEGLIDRLKTLRKDVKGFSEPSNPTESLLDRIMTMGLDNNDDEDVNEKNDNEKNDKDT